MLKFKLLLLAIVLTLSAQAQKKTELPDQAALLNDAYQTKSTEKLLDFFNNWHKEIPTVTDAELAKMNDIVREAYKVFTAFYHFDELKKLGGLRLDNIYNDSHFLVIQNTLEIRLADKIYWTAAEADSATFNNIRQRHGWSDEVKNKELANFNTKSWASTKRVFGPGGYLMPPLKENALYKFDDFKPLINVAGKQPLYLTKKYDSIINTFLIGPAKDWYKANTEQQQQFHKESSSRQIFVEQQIKILLGWLINERRDLLSHPRIKQIVFEKGMKYAKVAFEVSNEGGEAILINSNGKWSLQSAKRTYIVN